MENLLYADLKRPDSAGRIAIGREYYGKLFAVQPQPNGDILLSPVVIKHEREAWLLNNPEALEAVRRGMEESARGEARDVGSFDRYVDEGQDDETETA